MINETYISPLSDRYGSEHMRHIFSQDNKFKTWRKLWIALAESQRELGLEFISQDAIDEMYKHMNDINYDYAEQIESEIHHDVMAHVLAYGEQCPNARGIIHLGATSCYISDNADLIIMRDALKYIKSKLINLIIIMSKYAIEYSGTVTVAYTHLQPAQYTTVGKRFTLWINELMMDLYDITYLIDNMQLLGSKGATGTQASMLKLFGGDIRKVNELDRRITLDMGFDSCVQISGQTYSRKVDTKISNVLAGISASASKFSNDIRILSSMGEMYESFDSGQVGSSAMPYKRNPIKCENISSLSRYVIVNSQNQQLTSSVQWFERTLDDSANRRLSLPELFIATDHILDTYTEVINGMVIDINTINRHVLNELPFVATENMMMGLVSEHGMDRQSVHEVIRKASIETRQHMANGGDNDLVERLANNGYKLELGEPSDYIGCAKEQTIDYIRYVSEYLMEVIK